MLLARGVAAAAAVLAVLLAWQGARLFSQDLAFTTAQTEVSFWGRGSYQPDAATRARVGRQLDALLAQAPAQPDYQLLAASYYDWQGYWAENPEVGSQYTRQAEQARLVARQARPAFLGSDP